MRIRDRIKRGWLKLRAWLAAGLLALLGVIGVSVVTAGSKDFSWTNPVENTDGSVFNPVTDQKETRIYCTEDGVQIPVIVVPGAATSYTASLATGEYQCYATVVSNEDAESFPSNSITVTIDPLIPNAPVLNP